MPANTRREFPDEARDYEQKKGSFDYVAVRSPNGKFAQDDNSTAPLLQFFLEMLLDHGEQVYARVFTGDAVRLVGINHQPELLASGD